MGVKGDKMKQDSVLATELLLERLASINGISSKKMFGGHGIFHDGKMFGMVDSKGGCYLKATETLAEEMIQKGSTKHGKMPYYTIPETVLNDPDTLLNYSQTAIDHSK